MELNTNFDFQQYGIGVTVADIKAEENKQKQHFSSIDEKSLNPFPVEAFPEKIKEIISSTNESLNYPIDFIGASILYSVALAIGNTYNIAVMNEWKETSSLYIAIVGRAGTNKSHPLTFALKPFEHRDSVSYKEYESKLKEYKQAISLTKKEREQQLINEPLKPVWKKFLLSDFTPEALAEVHKFNNRGVGVYADELAGWFKNFNRYHKGAEQEFWLSGWSGKPINIDRKTGEPVFIPKPFIPVIGTIQNGILNEIGKDSRSQNGFIDRILFVIPDSLQKHYWSETEIDSSIPVQWQHIIDKIIDLPLHLSETLTPKPELLQLSNDAKQVLKAWQRTNTDLCNNTDNEALASIYSKLEVYVIRFALIIEILNWACGESNKEKVGLQSVQAAIQLIEYFRKTAVKVHSLISNFSPIDKLPSDKRKLYEALPDRFTTELGLQIANDLEVSERTFKRFLNDKELFEKLSRGEYEKRL